MGDARNVKFGKRIELGKSHLKHDEIPQKGRSRGPVTKNWILNPLRKSKTGEHRNFKFGVRVDPGKSHLMTDKIPPLWAWSGSRVEFLNSKTPYLN